MSKKRFQRGAFNLFHFAEKTKSNNAPKSRALKLEALEERQLLAVSFEEFAAVGAASELGVSVLDPNEPIELALEQDEAQTWVVSSTADSNVLGTLRYALASAQDGDTITFDAGLKGQTIVLSGSQLEITKSITIDASALLDANDPTPQITINANRASRVFQVAASVEATFKGLTISGGRVYRNDYSGYGGGVNVGNYASATFVDCVVTENEAGCPNAGWGAYGGGIYFGDYTNGTFENCVISNNKALETNSGSEAYGGGIAFGANAKIASFVNCLIADNIAQGSGGAYGARYGGGHGGAFFFDSSSQLDARFVNCAVVNNSANYVDGRMYNSRYTGDSIVFQNSIVVLDNASALADWSQLMGAASAFNSLSNFSAWANASDPDVVNYAYDPNSPLFVDAENADYRIPTNSQAVDRGNNSYISLDKDLAGSARVFNSVVDLGPYESFVSSSEPLAAPTLAISQTGDASPIATIGEVFGASQYVLECATDSAFNNVVKTWIFDGSGAKTLEDAPAGAIRYFRVKATALDRYDSNYATASAFISNPALVVSSTSDDANVPGTLRYALANSRDGDTITFDAALKGQTIVLSGSQLEVTKSITIDASALLDANDSTPQITIDANRASRVFQIAAGVAATFNGLTITNGHTYNDIGSGGGVYVLDCASATFVNCAITGNEAGCPNAGWGAYGGGVAFAVYSSGSFENCVITNNRAFDTTSGGEGYGGGVCFRENAKIASFTNCLIANNVAQGSNQANNRPGGGHGAAVFFTESNRLEASFVNCTIANNSANNRDGSMWDPRYTGDGITFQNTIVSLNDASALSDWSQTMGVASAFNTLSEFTAWSNAADPGVVNYALDQYARLFVYAENADYHLARESVAIDKGDNECVASDRDLDGGARIVGTAVDLGAYEYVPSEAKTWTVTSAEDSVNVEGTLRYAIANAKDGETIVFDSALKGQTIVLSGSQLEITKSITIDASALLDADDPTPQITIDANRASRVFNVAAGVEATFNGLTITNGYLYVNNVGGWGGGVFVGAHASAMFVNCAITGNEAGCPNAGWSSYGGGVCFSEYASGTFENCVITNNRAFDTTSGGEGYGGAVYFGTNSKIASFTNCLIANNVAQGSNQVNNRPGGGHGAAFFFAPSDQLEASFVNCTIANNSANYRDGSMWDSRYTGDSITFQNSVIYLNKASALSDWAQIMGAASAFNTLSEFTAWSNAADPGVVNYALDQYARLFVDAENADYRLARESVAIDKGDNEFVTFDYDLDGGARIVGTYVDLGAYEYVPRDVTTWTVNSLLDDPDLAGTLRYSLANAKDGDSIVFDPALKGQTIVLSGSQLEVVKSIAIDASSLLDPNDPTPQITIDANRASRVFQVAAGVEASFKGLTIAGGYVYRNDYSGYGGGVNVGNYASATFVDCVVTENEAGCPNAGWGAYGGGIYFGDYTSATFENSVISNNIARETQLGGEAYGGGIAFGANAKIASFTNCLVVDNAALGSNVAYGARYGGGHGGAIFFASSDQLNASFVNCSVANNAANYVDGRAYTALYSGDSISFQNSVVYLDGAGALSDWSQTMSGASALNTLSNFSAWANASSPGVVNYAYDPNSPLFADPENGDYRLPADSQAVDRGNNALVSVDTDLTGAQRVFNGTVDLGPYEFVLADAKALDAPTLTLSQTEARTLVATIGNVPGAERYVLELATDSAFSNLVISRSYNSSGAQTLTGLSSGATYYARVKATALYRLDSNFANATIALENLALVVSSNLDDVNVPGTLRYAIANAQAGDTITFAPELKGQTIVLSGSQLTISKSITIDASAL
ncbi:MAG: hypothetical protein IJM30_09175, partial [Thermoguttaceae bacterium]|nr:hypothetical protein [Thermoguttaceae bacterium]